MDRHEGAGSTVERHWSRTATWWLLPMLALAVHGPSLSGAWVYDDWNNFDRNQALRTGDWVGLVTRPYYGHDTTYWRPVTSLLMAVGYLAGPLGMHAIAIALHVLTAGVLASIGRRLLGDPRLALCAALLFTLHPLQVESVAWASALPSVPCALFTLLTVRSVSIWSTGEGDRPPWPAAAWLLGALLSKEAGVAAVPLVIAIVFGAGCSRPRMARLAVSGLAILLAVLWFALHVAMAGYRPVLGDDAAWVAGTAHMWFGQIALLLVPWPLTPFRAHPSEIGGPLIDLAVVLALIACIAFACARWRRLAQRWQIAGALTALPLLLAAVTHAAVGPHPLTDRYMYGSLGGFALLVAALIGRRFVLLGALVLAYGGMTVAQVRVWQDDRAFVSHVCRHSPNDASVHVLAGNLALQSGDAAGRTTARREFETALGLWSERTDDFAERQRAAAIAGLAWCDFTDPARAAATLGPSLIERFRRAVNHHRRYVPAWVGLGVALNLNARFDEARMAFETALALDPMCPEAWFNLGRLQLDLGQCDAACESFRAAVRCKPDLEVAHELLARLR
ncbi:MAG: tetratricopeptide repeat protein [Planctomycetes bacterium]|nr:tetratricopeptide repeat protein [Planctomycetota bacterium]